MPKFTIVEVDVEVITKGRNSYSVANVVYSNDRQENKTKKIMSFANPSVFSTIKDAKAGEVYEVSYTPGDQYYNWAAVQKLTTDGVGPTSPSKAPTVGSGKVLGSTYETAEERKIKQLLIVRQSSIANAITMLSVGSKVPPKVGEVLEVAQEFVDYVYSTDETLAAMDPDTEGVPEA